MAHAGRVLLNLRMSHRARCLPLLAFAALALPASAAAKTPPLGFYDTPAAVPAHGKLIRSMPVKGGVLPANGRARLVLYSSQGIDGSNIAVSGIVVLPKGKRPKGGFPIVSWAHGTTGIADVCAPSRSATDRVRSDYDRNFRRQMSQWLARGWAVALTDYQGLGTAGLHQYLVGVAEGRAVVDIVSAARELSSKVGNRWAAIGHSQGGHAALWAAALGPDYAPDLELEGVVGVAPASHIGEQAAVIDSVEGNPFGALPALIIAGALDAAGSDPATALSDRALALYPQVDRVCLDELSEPGSFGGLPLSEHFREGYDTTRLVALANANDPEELVIEAPVQVLQGDADTTVFPTFTEQLVDSYEARGITVEHRTFKDVDHTAILEAGRRAALKFLSRVLR